MWRDLELGDIPKLAGFAPEDWNLALDRVVLEHFGRGYFHARVAVESGRVEALGQGIATGQSGWIGNVIVRPEARRRGLGSRMTTEIMDHLRSRGCSTLLLIATALGEPVYRRLGFRRTGEYVFLRPPRLPVASASSIRRLRPEDGEAVLAMDARATAEARAELLSPHLSWGWGRFDSHSQLRGFFLPSFGNGFVVAGDPEAGVELLRFRQALYPGNVVVPGGNTAALGFLLEQGAEETGRAPRMACGDDLGWRPEMIYARASGYCG